MSLLPPTYSANFLPFFQFSFDAGAQEGSHPVRGEMAVWRAVITQALMDASSHSHKPEARYQKFEARRWLEGRSEDFVTVCENAGLDPSYVRGMSLKALETDCQWRAEPKQTTRRQSIQHYRQRQQRHNPLALETSQTLPPPRMKSRTMVIPFTSPAA